MLGRMDSYISDYEHIFRSKIKCVFDKAQIYCKGVFVSELSNIERISEEMFVNYHQMQHFISESPWNHRELIDKAALDVSGSLPSNKLTGLIIDESGWEKKGKKSVVVSPQYCGNVGKVANSQVAVFGALSNGDFASMVDARLYLPNSCCEYEFRCDEAGIPKESRAFKKEWELAVDIIRHQQSLGINCDYVSGDGYYGNSIELAQAVEDIGYVYMFDIHSNLTIYLAKAEIGILPSKSKRGRKPTKEKPLSESILADKYMIGLS